MQLHYKIDLVNTFCTRLNLYNLDRYYLKHECSSCFSSLKIGGKKQNKPLTIDLIYKAKPSSKF